jgi:AhpD family alkylhydroperoxidase
MSNDLVLTEKEWTLIAIGASVAAGCQPCTAHHIKAADAAGACKRSIQLAVETALAGRESATAVMDEWAGQCQGLRPEVDAGFRAQKQLIVDLTAVAAAVALNSVPDLQKHLAEARKSGANHEQIQSTIEIARKIKRVAEEKIEAITIQLAGSARPAPSVSEATSCCSGDSVHDGEVTVATRPDCGCR